MLYAKKTMLLFVAVAVLFLTLPAYGGQLYLKVTLDSFKEPVPVNRITSLIANISIGEGEDSKENEANKEDMYQSHTVTFGDSATSDGMIAMITKVTPSEDGFTVTKPKPNVCVLTKKGRNKNPLSLTIEGKFGATGRDRPVKVESTVTLSGGKKVTDSATTFGDVFDMFVLSAFTCENAGRGSNATADGYYRIPMLIPPYITDKRTDTAAASSNNKDIQVDGPTFADTISIGGGVGWSLWAKPGYPGKYNFQGNRNAVGNWKIFVTETGGGGSVTRTCDMTVTNARPVIIETNLPVFIGAGNTEFFIRAGDAEGSVTITALGDIQKLTASIETALTTLGLGAGAMSTLEGVASVVEKLTKILGSTTIVAGATLDGLVATAPKINSGSCEPYGDDGSVVQHGTIALPQDMFYDIVRATRAVSNMVWIFPVTIDVKSNDGGPSFSDKRTIEIK